MRFFEVVLSGAALVSTAFAVKPTIDTYPNTGVVAGQSYTITYSPKNVAATFILRRGLSANLDTVATLGQASGGTFTWTVDKTLPDASNYALEITTQGEEPNYSGQFGLTGGTGSLSSAIASAASSAMASMTSAASSATPSSNATISSATLSKTASSSTKPTSSSSSPPESTGAAAALGSSPMALVFGAAVAFFYLA